MPAFSGLWDGTHGDAYANRTKADALPPIARGIIRRFMQSPSMHGHVNALGRNAPATRAAIDAELGDITVPGGYDYAARQHDAGNRVTMTNHASHIDGNDINETHSRVPDATAADLVHTYDTTKRVGYPGDDAGNGVTGGAVAASVES